MSSRIVSHFLADILAAINAIARFTAQMDFSSGSQAPAWEYVFLKLCFLYEAELHSVCAQAELGH
ncbi:MAG: hypothetical protein Q3M30_07630 [Candidatus Electrothrix sp. Rat3]|nr:hypothetical protein [Candidatus Electrothrix rattekaaiensis]